MLMRKIIFRARVDAKKKKEICIEGAEENSLMDAELYVSG